MKADDTSTVGKSLTHFDHDMLRITVFDILAVESRAKP